ncbi:leucine-rich repeat protein soc-2 homolog [Xenopus laevis]|uniref:Disease resistance R13L4/SHOC-2-like LRR domain-containing protein n=2 Tax=Xenopus laevis TaxID=8355 RepID=A0A974CKG4_XENLA|nr:leucine-rich repeat protein soc-2 homolog [Xenopus laevis]OCT75054.1 hypothetical protein XELAEV_18034042mg [Xenopus laevis]
MKAALSGPSFPYKPCWKLLSEMSKSGKAQRKLKVEGKELSSLPEELFNFEDTQILKMSPERESCLSYQMGFVPKEIGHLMNLTALYIDSNNLQEIPPEVGMLKNLKRLVLSNNALSILPLELGMLQNLQSIHLANNNFTIFPSVICHCPNLTFLDISDNKIEIIPPTIEHLKNLETLLLLFNRISKLPKGLCSLTKLRCLWLGNNNIRELPDSFGNLALLDWGDNYCSFDLDGNPLNKPPIEVCMGGPQRIKAYFSSYHNNACYNVDFRVIS